MLHTVPCKTDRDYLDQMTAEVREEREDSRSRIKVLWVQKHRDNHHIDCELMTMSRRKLERSRADRLASAFTESVSRRRLP